MGIYTIHKEQWVDRQIEKRLREIVTVVTRDLPCIDSIILTGGFGKGEGSVNISDGVVTPLRDFDFVVIFKKVIPQKKMDTVKRLLDRGNSTNGDYKYNKEFSLDISATTLENINLFPDLMTYDLKESRVIYGRDLRSEIRWTAQEIPLRSGARLLFQKSTALIGSFSLEYLSGRLPQIESDVFLREASKVYVEISGALCILAGKYDSHCQRRVILLKEIYADSFPDLQKIAPDLIQKIDASARHKVDPANNPIRKDPVDYWFMARDDLFTVIRYYFGKYLHIPSADLVEFAASLEKNLLKEYYLPLINNYLSTKKLPTCSFLVRQLNTAYNFKQNIDYSTRAIRDHKFSLSLTKGVSSPCIKLFSVCLLILFSINRDGTINNKYLDAALGRLNFVKLVNCVPDNRWEETRLKCLRLLNLSTIR